MKSQKGERAIFWHKKRHREEESESKRREREMKIKIRYSLRSTDCRFSSEQKENLVQRGYKNLGVSSNSTR